MQSFDVAWQILFAAHILKLTFEQALCVRVVLTGCACYSNEPAKTDSSIPVLSILIRCASRVGE